MFKKLACLSLVMLALASPALALVVDFNNYSIQSYGGTNQDINGTASVSVDGTTLSLAGNTWKSIALPYTVTADTYLSFDFLSSSKGELHGIGLDNNSAISSNRTFKLFGTQTGWGLQDFNTYSSLGDWVTYAIPVGQYFTGSFSLLTFMNDHDVANPTGNSSFRNVELGTPVPAPEPATVILLGVGLIGLACYGKKRK